MPVAQPVAIHGRRCAGPWVGVTLSDGPHLLPTWPTGSCQLRFNVRLDSGPRRQGWSVTQRMSESSHVLRQCLNPWSIWILSCTSKRKARLYSFAHISSLDLNTLDPNTNEGD